MRPMLMRTEVELKGPRGFSRVLEAPDARISSSMAGPGDDERSAGARQAQAAVRDGVSILVLSGPVGRFLMHLIARAGAALFRAKHGGRNQGAAWNGS